MKVVFHALLVISLVSSLSCSASAPKNSIPDIQQTPVTGADPPGPKIKPPESTPSPSPPPRVDKTLVSIEQMHELWASDQVPYFGLSADDSPTNFSKAEALKRGKAWFISHNVPTKGIDIDAMLVVEARVTVDPKFYEFNRLTWFIVAPPVMGLWVPGFATVPSRESPALYFWANDYTVMMDDETGEFWGGSTINKISHLAPRFTINQFEIMQQYADIYGWWAAWYRTQGYNGSLLPQNVIDEIQGLIK